MGAGALKEADSALPLCRNPIHLLTSHPLPGRAPEQSLLSARTGSAETILSSLEPGMGSSKQPQAFLGPQSLPPGIPCLVPSQDF